MQWLSVDNWVYPQQVGRCMHYAFATVDVLVLYTEMIAYTQRCFLVHEVVLGYHIYRSMKICIAGFHGFSLPMIYLRLYQGQMPTFGRSLVRVLDEYSLMMSLAMEQNHDLLTVDTIPLANTTVHILRMLV